MSEVEDVQNTLTFMRTDLEPFEQYSYRLYGVYESLQDSTPHSAAGEANSFRSESKWTDCWKHCAGRISIVL